MNAFDNRVEEIQQSSLNAMQEQARIEVIKTYENLVNLRASAIFKTFPKEVQEEYYQQYEEAKLAYQQLSTLNIKQNDNR